MKSDPAHMLSVSRAAMGGPIRPAPSVWMEGEPAEVPPRPAERILEVRIECGSAGVPPLEADEGLLAYVVGIRVGAFRWS